MIPSLRLLASSLVLVHLSTAIAAEPSAPSGAAPQRSVALDDIKQIKSPDGPYPSRDGKQIAYVVHGQIYVVPTSGGTPRTVTSTGSTASAPYWSLDGGALYFLSDRSGKNQLWKLPVMSLGSEGKSGVDRCARKDRSPHEGNTGTARARVAARPEAVDCSNPGHDQAAAP